MTNIDLTGLTEVKSREGRIGYVIGDEVIAAECTKCGEVKSKEEFVKQRGRILGVTSNCKECRRIYREANRDKIAEGVRIYREANRDKINEQRRIYREANRAKISVQRRIYYEANREALIEKSRVYYEANRDRVAEYKRIHHEANRDKKAEYDRIYREVNREEISDKERIYRMENPEIFKIIGQRRRARKEALPDNLTIEQYDAIYAHFNGVCALSGDSDDIHADHVIPLSVGHGGTIYENMIPLRADLNISKHARNIFDWFADNRERFGLEQRRFDELITYLADINGMSTQEYEEYVRWCHDNPRDLTKEDDDATA